MSCEKSDIIKDKSTFMTLSPTACCNQSINTDVIGILLACHQSILFRLGPVNIAAFLSANLFQPSNRIMDNTDNQNKSNEGDITEEYNTEEPNAFDSNIENMISSSNSPPEWFNEQQIEELYKSICDPGSDDQPQTDNSHDGTEMANPSSSSEHLDCWAISDPDSSSKSSKSPEIFKSASDENEKDTTSCHDNSPSSNNEVEQIHTDLGHHQHETDIQAAQNQALHESITTLRPSFNNDSKSEKENEEMDSTENAVMPCQIQHDASNEESDITTTRVIFQPIHNCMLSPTETFHRKLLSPGSDNVADNTKTTNLQLPLVWPIVDVGHTDTPNPFLRCRNRATRSKRERSSDSTKAKPLAQGNSKQGTPKKSSSRNKARKAGNTKYAKSSAEPNNADLITITANETCDTLEANASSELCQNPAPSNTSEDSYNPTQTTLPSQVYSNQSLSNIPLQPCNNGSANASPKPNIDQNPVDIDNWTCHSTLSNILTELYMYYGPIKVDGATNEEKLFNLLQLYKNRVQINDKCHEIQNLIQFSENERSKSDFDCEFHRNQEQTFTTRVVDPAPLYENQDPLNTLTSTHDPRSSLVTYDSPVESTIIDQSEVS